MNSIVSFLLRHLGLENLAEIVIPIEIDQLRHEDRPAIVRALTMSENTVRHLCEKTGANFESQITKRDAAANAFADFVLGFAPADGQPTAA